MVGQWGFSSPADRESMLFARPQRTRETLAGVITPQPLCLMTLATAYTLIHEPS